MRFLKFTPMLEGVAVDLFDNCTHELLLIDERELLMCGRFTVGQTGEAIAQSFQLATVPSWQPRYNLAPTQPVPVVRLNPHSREREFSALHWGLIPSWASDAKIGARLINARAETVADKPSFRHALRHKRCLVVADGFYEWHQQGRSKQPYFFYLPAPEPNSTGSIPAHRPFAFAGLWEHWQSAAGDEIESCTIITTDANALLQSIHHRMPVIVAPEQYDQWLDPSGSVDQVRSLLHPYPAKAMSGYPVSPQMNRPQYDAPACIEPVHDARSLLQSTLS